MSIILGPATDEQITNLREAGYEVLTQNVFEVQKLFGKKALLRPGEKLCLVYLPERGVADILQGSKGTPHKESNVGKAKPIVSGGPRCSNSNEDVVRSSTGRNKDDRSGGPSLRLVR